MTKAKTYTSEKEKKSVAGFLYLFVALARRKSQEESVKQLQRLSGLIESEISELQHAKRKIRLRDVVK